MTEVALNLPAVVRREEWLAERKRLLAREKEFTKARDALNAARRRLPMVEIRKEYTLDGPDGSVGLADLFDGRRQLIVYHFMFHPDWDEGCPGCSFVADNVGHLSHLHARNTSLVFVSRAPLEKLERYRDRMGWTVPWYSSGGSDFNHDFQATLDPSIGAVEYNYQVEPPRTEKIAGRSIDREGASVFLESEGRVYHTYSTYARGLDILLGTYHWLDLTALGRQEDWEEPAGRGDGPMMHWVRRHDRYPNGTAS